MLFMDLMRYPHMRVLGRNMLYSIHLRQEENTQAEQAINVCMAAAPAIDSSVEFISLSESYCCSSRPPTPVYSIYVVSLQVYTA